MKRLYLLIFAFTIVANAQTVEWFPDDLTVQPFTANFLEPRMGFMFELNKNDIRLEIGSSMDIYRSSINDGTQISFGADLFTYTLLRGEKDFHFPVDAVDYLFGLNGAYIIKQNSNEYGVRTRFSHISAHFVDGHYDGTTQQWKNNHNPLVYSREFLEVIGFYKVNNLRFYGGATYIIHIDPTTIGKDIYQLGFDYYYGGLLDGKVIPFVAYDLRISNLDKYYSNNSVMVGLKFGKINSKGFRIYFEYYKGKNIHGEYYFDNEEFSSFGFNLEF